MTDWKALHIHYHGDLDRPLAEMVSPLITDLRDRNLLTRWFFLRYWDRGSHLRLRLAGPDEPRSRMILESAKQHADGYLAARPSTETLPDDEYRRLAQIFAAAEGITGGIDDQLPNNVAVRADYLAEHDRFGTGQTLAAVEDHFCVSSGIALRLVTAGAGEPERLTACLGFLLAAWRIAMPQAPRLGDFVEVLFESWRRRLGPSIAPDREAMFTATYQRRRARLLAATRRPADPVTALWRRSLKQVATAVADAVAGGAFRPPLRPGWEGLVDTTEDDVAVLSVLDLCAHLTCNRLGLSMVQESYLRFIAASLVREQTDLTPEDHLQEVR